MAFIPTLNCINCKMIFTQAGQFVQNNFYFQTAAPPTATDLDATNTFMHTFWTNQLKANINNTVALVQIQSIDLSSANAQARSLFISPPEAGTLTVTSPLPSNVSIVATARTVLRGRNYRGRIYLPGLGSDYLVSPVTYSATQIVNIITALSWLLNVANTASEILVVVSKFLNKVARSSGVKTPVTSWTMDTALDSQRRRLLGRGR